jgi:hypothetical protein
MLSLVFMSSDIISAMSITISSTLQSSYLAGKTFGAVFEGFVRFGVHDRLAAVVGGELFSADPLDCRRFVLGDCSVGAAIMGVVAAFEESFNGRD